MERPLNTRLYRTAWLVVAVPVLAAAFSITRPSPAPSAAATLQPAFDNSAAYRLANELASVYPDRSPGAPASVGAARWVHRKLSDLGLDATVSRFNGTVPGRGRVELRNVSAVVPGRSRDTIAVVAHRDSSRGHAGTNDNASGTGALIELARAYSATRTAGAGGVSPNHTLLFVSTDAGAYGLLGARHLARGVPQADHIVSVVVLDSIASKRGPRLELAGRGPRSPAPELVATAAARLEDESGSRTRTPGALGQLVDLAFPLSLTEQNAFLAEGLSAVTVTTEGSRAGRDDRPGRLDPVSLGRVGRAVESLVASLDAGEPARGTNPYVLVRGRVIQGWAIVLLYLALLVPFAVSLVDLVARLRRWHIPLRPAFRSYTRRLGFWLFVGGAFAVFGWLGAWPDGDPAPVNPASEAAGHWPRLALVGLAFVVCAGWLVARTRLIPRGPVAPEAEVAGLAAALSALAAITLVLIATNPYTLLLVLPSAHAWLWLTQLRTAGTWSRGLLYAAGLAGPLVVLGSTALRFGLGLDAPWYLAELTAIGYVSLLALFLFLAWLAVAAQVFAVASSRYAPYPPPADRPTRGPVGTVVASLRQALGSR